MNSGFTWIVSPKVIADGIERYGERALVALQAVTTAVFYDAAFAALTQARGGQARRAISQLTLIGGFAGYFVVPMNALLQHRGHVLLSAGHSIAVQNFNENLSILAMLAIYSLMIAMNLHINVVIVIFGAFVAATMFAVMRWNAANHRANPHLDRLIGEAKH